MSKRREYKKYKFIVYKFRNYYLSFRNYFIIKYNIYVLKLLCKWQINKILKHKIENNFKRIILRHYKEIMYRDE